MAACKQDRDGFIGIQDLTDFQRAVDRAHALDRIKITLVPDGAVERKERFQREIPSLQRKLHGDLIADIDPLKADCLLADKADQLNFEVWVGRADAENRLQSPEI